MAQSGHMLQPSREKAKGPALDVRSRAPLGTSQIQIPRGRCVGQNGMGYPCSYCRAGEHGRQNPDHQPLSKVLLLHKDSTNSERVTPVYIFYPEWLLATEIPLKELFHMTCDGP
jgi:hypothetical protein